MFLLLLTGLLLTEPVLNAGILHELRRNFIGISPFSKKKSTETGKITMFQTGLKRLLFSYRVFDLFSYGVFDGFIVARGVCALATVPLGARPSFAVVVAIVLLLLYSFSTC